MYCFCEYKKYNDNFAGPAPFQLISTDDIFIFYFFNIVNNKIG
jgi:hypothetical protein